VCLVLARQITSDLFASQGMALTTFACTAAKVRLGQAAMSQPETKVEDLCVELGVTRQILYRHVAPDGSLLADGQRLLDRKRPSSS
jgi:hypothetical protein